VPPKKVERFLGIWLLSLPKTLKWGLLFGASIIWIRDSVVSLDTVRGSSMAPTLSPDAHEKGIGDWVVIHRVAPTLDLKRGDIVTFWKPHKPGEISIKRVIGLPGDTVYPARGYALEEADGKRLGLYDGQEVSEATGKREKGKVVVPHNHVWVEGDNWRKSYDSNDFGPITMGLIDGKATKVWRDGYFRKIEDGRTEVKSRVVEAEAEGEHGVLSLA
jgi:inner membrane protease subunit 2